MVESKLESLIQRLESAVARQEALIGGHSSTASAVPAKASESKNAKEFVALILPKIKAVKDAAAALGIA